MVEPYILRQASTCFGERQIVCDHCSALEKVLTELVGLKVSAVIMRRVTNEVHVQSLTGFPKAPALNVNLEAMPVSPIVPKRYALQA